MYLYFLFLHKNICCGFSLELPHQGDSKEYPQHMFLMRNKKNINEFSFEKKVSYLGLLQAGKHKIKQKRSLLDKEHINKAHRLYNISLPK